MTKGGVDLGDFGGEEGAALQLCEGRKGWIFQEKGTEFLPGILGENVGEITGSEFGATKRRNPSRPPRRRGVPGGRWCLLIRILHLVCIFSETCFDGTKVQNFAEIRKEKRKYFGIILINVE